MSTPNERVAMLELADFYEEGEQLPAQPCCEHRCNMAPRAAYCNSGHPLSARVPPIPYVEDFLRAGGVLAQLARALRRFEFHTKKTDDGEKTITFTPTFICKYIERKLYFGETPQNTIAVQRIMHLAGGSGPKDRLEYADVIGDRVFQKLLKDIYDVYDMGHTKDDAETEVITEVANFMRSYLDEHSPIYTVRRENLRGSKLRIVFKKNAAGEKEVIDPGVGRDVRKFSRTPSAIASRVVSYWFGKGIIKRRERTTSRNQVTDDELLKMVSAHEKNVAQESRKAYDEQEDRNDENVDPDPEDELLAPPSMPCCCWQSRWTSCWPCPRRLSGRRARGGFWWDSESVKRSTAGVREDIGAGGGVESQRRCGRSNTPPSKDRWFGAF